MPAPNVPSLNEKPNWRQILKAVPFLVRFVYQADPRSFLLYVFGGVAQAPLSAIGVIATKRIVDAFALANRGEVLRWSLIFIACLVVAALISYLVEVSADLLRFRLEYAKNERALELLASLPFSILEQTEFRVLADAYWRKSHTLLNLNQWSMWSIYHFAGLVGFSFTFAYFPWPTTGMILAAILVRVWISQREAAWSWSLFNQEKREGRRAEYLRGQLATPFSLFAVKGWDLHRPFLSLWKKFSTGLLKIQVRNVMKMGVGVAVSELLFVAAVAAGLWSFYADLGTGSITVGAAAAFLASFTGLWSALGRFLSNIRLLQREAPFMVIIRDFFSLAPEKEEGRKLPSEPLRIEFQDVWFRYPGSDKDILQGVNFVFGEGEHVAMVGLNGAGKTTLLKLLMGVFPPTRGRILVNGMDVAKVKPSAWRRALSVLPQDVPRFDDVLREQVLYGDYERELDKGRLKMSLTTSGLQALSEELPRGLDTHAGKHYAMPEDEAIELSGGQNQVAGIARTLYREARLYIFDEPTAAVDAEKEERFFERLPEALQGKGILFVSHRFSTLRRANRIIVLDSGRVIEDGTHDELLAKQGRYAELFTLQAKSYQ